MGQRHGWVAGAGDLVTKIPLPFVRPATDLLCELKQVV